MTDLWLKYRANIVMAAGVVAAIIILVVFYAGIMLVGGVWGPGWLGDLVDWMVG